MNPNKALWEKGDFTRIAQSMRDSGEALVKSLAITKGLKVLDLGSGDGTTALPEAMLGADVLAVDIASNLIAAGNKRAKEQGLANCKFQEGDASNLHELKDHSFDLVVSIFGAMFAPRPFDVAKEMVRVARPDGRIVLCDAVASDNSAKAAAFNAMERFRDPSTVEFRTVGYLQRLYADAALPTPVATFYQLAVELEGLLKTSFPAGDDRDGFRAMVRDAVDGDAMGVQACVAGGTIRFEYSVAILAAIKP